MENISLSLETGVLRVELMSFTLYCLNVNIRFGARQKDSAHYKYRHGAVHSRPPAKDYSSVACCFWGRSGRTLSSWLCKEGIHTSKYLPYRVVVRTRLTKYDVLCHVVDLVRCPLIAEWVSAYVQSGSGCRLCQSSRLTLGRLTGQFPFLHYENE